MKMLIKEFANFTGVSVRTLHYYDEIGLMKPAIVDEQTGYRYYDEKSLERMQEILFYRELDFSLKSICAILSSPDYDKAKGYSKEKNKELAVGLEEILEEFADCMKSGATAGANEAQALVKRLQDYITLHYYTCTNEILAGLGKMYVADERFKKNINKHAKGTAEYISEAIDVYCKGNM